MRDFKSEWKSWIKITNCYRYVTTIINDFVVNRNIIMPHIKKTVISKILQYISRYLKIFYLKKNCGCGTHWWRFLRSTGTESPSLFLSPMKTRFHFLVFTLAKDTLNYSFNHLGTGSRRKLWLGLASWGTNTTRLKTLEVGQVTSPIASKV